MLVLVLSWLASVQCIARLEGEFGDGGARGLRIFVDSNLDCDLFGDRSEEEGDRRAVEACRDDDAQDDGAVQSSAGPPLANVIPARYLSSFGTQK